MDCTLCDTDTFHARLDAGTQQLYLTRCWTCRGGPLMVVSTRHHPEFLPAERALIESLFTGVRFEMRSMPEHAHAHLETYRHGDVGWRGVSLIPLAS